MELHFWVILNVSYSYKTYALRASCIIDSANMPHIASLLSRGDNVNDVVVMLYENSQSYRPLDLSGGRFYLEMCSYEAFN